MALVFGRTYRKGGGEGGASRHRHEAQCRNEEQHGGARLRIGPWIRRRRSAREWKAAAISTGAISPPRRIATVTAAPIAAESSPAPECRSSSASTRPPEGVRLHRQQHRQAGALATHQRQRRHQPVRDHFCGNDGF
jgi:hypothetical protein